MANAAVDNYQELLLGHDSDEEVENSDELEGSDSNNDSDSESGEEFGAKWQKKWLPGDPTLPNRCPIFSGDRGIKAALPPDPKTLDFVQLFVDEECYVILTNETNRYAHQYLSGRRLPTHSRFRKWPEGGIRVSDMKCFMALIVGMGLVVQEDMEDYWSTDPVLQTPFFTSVMSRDHFMNILSFFHLADNTEYIPRGTEGYNPLKKLGQVYEIIISRFNSVWYPGQALSIDEGMIPFRGKTHMRVYAPDKPAKYGLKSYQVCDSDNAYCTQFTLYAGKDQNQPSAKGRTYDLVTTLMEPYMHKGHTLYVDNYYSSPTLFMDLYKEGTGACGTARLNRKGMPLKVKNEKLRRKGDKVVMHNGPLLCMKLKDSKDVTMLSTVHESGEVPTGKHDRAGNPKVRSGVIHQYNQKMGAVDRSDQMVAYSSFRRRTLKWWKKAFFHVTSLAILNAWIIYREWCQENNHKNCLQRTFRRNFLKELLGSVDKTPVEKTPLGRKGRGSEQLRRLKGRHFPSKVRVKENCRRRPTRRCAVCMPAEQELRKEANLPAVARPGRESSYECSKCDVGLCAAPCFMMYHKYKHYVLAYKRSKENLPSSGSSSSSDDSDDEE